MGANTHIYFGYVGKDAETRFISSGKQVTSFSIAQDRGYMGQDGNWQNKAQWVKCTAWEKAAERAAQIKRGMLVIAWGTETPNAYINNAGEAASSLELKLEGFKFYQTIKTEHFDVGDGDERNLSDDEDVAF